MLNINRVNQTVNTGKSNIITPKTVHSKPSDFCCDYAQKSMPRISGELYRAYNPAFGAKSIPVNTNTQPKKVSVEEQMKTVSSKLDAQGKALLRKLSENGKLNDNSSNDGSTVLDNLYKTATEPRIPGLKEDLIITEVLKAIDNPASITQKFGDIPDNVASEISAETGTPFPEDAKDVVSSCCVVASMEYNMASRTPAEFARFAADLSGHNYSVEKNVKMSDISDGTASVIWMLREFNTDSNIKNWDDVSVNIRPDRNAIVRARVQTSYKDPGERSCVDVLIQSALLNLGSQHTYDALTDERTGKFNPERTGLTDFEKNFVEEIVFATPKISVVYQVIDENGYLTGYNCEPEETKQHILKSLQAGQNVIIGYTHLDRNKMVDGGHEITITDYKTDKNGNGVFVCNDTDDNIDKEIEIEESKLLPLIHHAGITKDALSADDVVVEPWREVLEEIKSLINSKQPAV